MTDSESEIDVFKRCSCSRTWVEREDFLSDPEIELVGYQVNFHELELGLFYFNHNHEGCHSTLAIYAQEFKDLNNGPVFRERMTGKPGCPTFCLEKESTAPCNQQCECAWVRDIMQQLKKWPKSAPAHNRAVAAE